MGKFSHSSTSVHSTTVIFVYTLTWRFSYYNSKIEELYYWPFAEKNVLILYLNHFSYILCRYFIYYVFIANFSSLAYKSFVGRCFCLFCSPNVFLMPRKNMWHIVSTY